MTIAPILPLGAARAATGNAVLSTGQGGTGEFLRAYGDLPPKDGPVVVGLEPVSTKEARTGDSKTESDANALMPDGRMALTGQRVQPAAVASSADGNGSGPAPRSGEAEGDDLPSPGVGVPPGESATADRLEADTRTLPSPYDVGSQPQTSPIRAANDRDEVSATTASWPPQSLAIGAQKVVDPLAPLSTMGASPAAKTGRADVSSAEGGEGFAGATPDRDVTGVQASVRQAADPAPSMQGAAGLSTVPAEVASPGLARSAPDGIGPAQIPTAISDRAVPIGSAQSTVSPAAAPVAGSSVAVPVTARPGRREAEWFGRLALAQVAISPPPEVAPETSSALHVPGFGKHLSASNDRLPAGPQASPPGPPMSALDPDMGGTGSAAFYALRSVAEPVAPPAVVPVSQALGADPTLQSPAFPAMAPSLAADQATASSGTADSVPALALAGRPPVDPSLPNAASPLGIDAVALGRPSSPEVPILAAPSVTSQPSPAPSVREVALLIVQASAGTDRQVEIVLAPQELGRLQIAFATEGDILRIVVSADRPETLDLLRRNADQLLQELRDAGVAGASLSFAQSDHRPQSGRQQPDATGGSGAKAPDALTADRMTDLPRPGRLASATLDLRL